MAAMLYAIRNGRASKPQGLVRLQGLGKHPLTSSIFELAIFRFVAWCLNHLRYRVDTQKIQSNVSLVK
jgi:hypothetical protein